MESEPIEVSECILDNWLISEAIVRIKWDNIRRPWHNVFL